MVKEGTASLGFIKNFFNHQTCCDLVSSIYPYLFLQIYQDHRHLKIILLHLEVNDEAYYWTFQKVAYHLALGEHSAKDFWIINKMEAFHY